MASTRDGVHAVAMSKGSVFDRKRRVAPRGVGWNSDVRVVLLREPAVRRAPAPGGTGLKGRDEMPRFPRSGRSAHIPRGSRLADLAGAVHETVVDKHRGHFWLSVAHNPINSLRGGPPWQLHAANLGVRFGWPGEPPCSRLPRARPDLPRAAPPPPERGRRPRAQSSSQRSAMAAARTRSTPPPDSLA